MNYIQTVKKKSTNLYLYRQNKCVQKNDKKKSNDSDETKYYINVIIYPPFFCFKDFVCIYKFYNQEFLERTFFFFHENPKQKKNEISKPKI